ncbi:MAG: hypothetical protein NC182_05260 [Prevotella sp.]|nr:hypothetical protein [Prevotella sp.]
MIVIEKIRSSFKTLDLLSKNLNNLHSLHLHAKSEDKIIDALKNLKLNYFINLDKELFDEISSNGPCLNNQLKEKFLNKYPTLNVAEYDDAVDSLIKESKIINSFDGLKVKRALLTDYISNANYQDIEIVKLTEEEKQTKVYYKHWFNKYLKINLKYGNPKYVYVGNYSNCQIKKIIKLANSK